MPPPRETMLALVAEHPLLAAVGAVLLVVVLAYAVLVAQQVLVAIWFLVTIFLVSLAWRFVIAVESIAAAADRYVEDRTGD